MNLGVHWEWTGNQPFSWKTQNPAICCPCISKYSGALIDGQPSHLTLYLPRPCFLLDNPKWQEHVNEGSESTLLLAHVPSLGSHLEQDHWGTPRDAHSKWLTLTCLDCHALVTREDHLHLGGFLACLPQSVQDAMPEGWQGLGEPRLLLVLNANSATTASVLKKTPRYHGCEVGKCMDYGASGFGGW